MCGTVYKFSFLLIYLLTYLLTADDEKKFSCLLAELVDDGFKHENRTSRTDDSEWLAGEHVVRDAAYSTAHQALHCRLHTPITIFIFIPAVKLQYSQ